MLVRVHFYEGKTSIKSADKLVGRTVHNVVFCYLFLTSNRATLPAREVNGDSCVLYRFVCFNSVFKS